MIKVNTDPECPGAGRAEKDYNLGRDRTHKDKGKYGYSHIPPDRWQAIFGVTLKLSEGETWTPETLRKAYNAR